MPIGLRLLYCDATFWGFFGVEGWQNGTPGSR